MHAFIHCLDPVYAAFVRAVFFPAAVRSADVFPPALPSACRAVLPDEIWRCKIISTIFFHLGPIIVLLHRKS